MVEFCHKNSTYILFFPLIHDKCQGHKSLPRHSIYVLHFKLYCWANQHRSLLFEKMTLKEQRQVPSPWSGTAAWGRNHGERGARAYNGGLGAVLPVGSRSKANEILAIKTVSLH